MISPGDVLQGRYRIEGPLGKGGMGTVYEATDLRFGSTVAVKQMTLGGEELVRAFEREARLLNKLRHSALPVVTDYFAEDDGYFLVMQYIPGDDLAASLVKRGGPFPACEVLEWADQLLGALAYLHTQDPPVIHRDVKPHNLKLTPRGEVILLDFGLSKSAGAAATAAATSVSVLGYTPHYAPFEQINGAGTDPRSDLFSLAATVYHLLTGVPPPDAVTRAQAIMAGGPDPLVPTHELSPQVPQAVSSVLQSALAMAREQRPHAAAVMREALRAARVGLTGAADVSQSQTLVDGPGMAPIDLSSFPASGPRQMFSSAPRAVTDGQAAGATSPAREGKARPSYGRWAAACGALTLALLGAGWWVWGHLARDSSARQIPPAAGPAARQGADAMPRGNSLPPPEATFRFETVELSRTGSVTARRHVQGKYYEEDLGGGEAIEMVVVPGGTYVMGSPESDALEYPDEEPPHDVTIRRFYLSRYEVTQRQWRAVATQLPKVARDLDPAPSAHAGDDLPVTNVSWDDVEEFCARLSRKSGRDYRLPSESEWEYAARAGTRTVFAFGETITTEVVNYDGTGPYGGGPSGPKRGEPVPVGSLKVANAFGLYDMHGNVWEWCAGEYHSDYKGAPSDGSPWVSGGDTMRRVLRGGSFNNLAVDCRSANRYSYPQDGKSPEVGFRLAASD